MTSSTEIACECAAMAVATAAVAFLAVRAVFARRLGRFARHAVIVGAAAASLTALASLAWCVLLVVTPWVYDRGEHTRSVAPGIDLRSFFRAHPRPHLVHVLTVELSTAGRQLLLSTPRAGDPNAYSAQRTSDFARAHDCAVAINASFFYPFRQGNPIDFYPRVGDRVVVSHPYGFRDDSAASGTPHAGMRAHVEGAQLWFTSDVPLNPHRAHRSAVVEGRVRLVRDGHTVTASPTLPESRVPYSRMALGVRGTQLVAVAVDGKLDGLAEGLTIAELTGLLIELHVEQAIELDGGGSVTLVTRHGERDYEVENLTSHPRIPFRERPVATHVGFR